LHDRRDWGEFGPKPIAWNAIQSWQQVNEIKLYGWELNLIFQLDTVFIKNYADSKK